MNTTNIQSAFIQNPQNNPGAQVTIFDDLISGNTNNGYPAGFLFRQSGNAGGGILGGAVGTADVAPQAGRVGLIGINTGPSGNSTGSGFIDCTTAQMYAGSPNIVLQWSAMIGALGTSTIGYTIEMGLGASYNASTNTGNFNSAYIGVNFVKSAQFYAVTGNNGSTNIVTTASSTFTVGASTWYNFQIIMTSAQAQFYVAPSGGFNYQLLATSTTFLPTLAQYCNPYFTIYKGSSTTTTSQFIMDWVQFSFSNFNR